MNFLKKQKHTIIILFLVLLNFIIKGIYLSSNSLAGDEPFSVYHAQMSIASIIQLLSLGNNPPLYEILLHFWIKIFGISELSVRVPSLIFSCITVLFIYKIGIKYLNNRIALYASLIFIFSNYHISLAHEARAYALLGMLTAISMYYFMGIIYDYKTNAKSDSNNRFNYKGISKYIILAVVNTLLIYTHYFGFFALIVQFLFSIFNLQFLRKNWKKMLLCMGIIVLLYVPNISVFFKRFIESSSGTWVPPVKNLGHLFEQIFFFSNENKFLFITIIAVLSAAIGKLFYHLQLNKYIKGLFLFLLIPLFFITAYSIFFQIPFIWKLTSNPFYFIPFTPLILCINLIWVLCKDKIKNYQWQTTFIVFWFVFIFSFMFIVSFRIPMFLDRYLMTAAIAFPLVIGISVDYLIRKPKYELIIPIVVILLFVLTVKPNITNKRDVKETVAKIKELKTNTTIVYFCPEWFDLNFVYYYNRLYFMDYDDKNIKNKIYHHLHSENIFPISNHNQIDINLIKHMDKIIYLDVAADFHYPKNNIKKELDVRYNLKNEYKFYEIFNVYEYELN